MVMLTPSFLLVTLALSTTAAEKQLLICHNGKIGSIQHFNDFSGQTFSSHLGGGRMPNEETPIPPEQLEKALSQFIQDSLENRDLGPGEVLSLNVEKSFCSEVNMYPLGDCTELKFLLRGEYFRLWEQIKSDFKAKKAFYQQAIVTGTAGIGKSAFRLFLLRQWLNNALGLEFGRVYIDLWGCIFRIERNGSVHRVNDSYVGDFSALGLFDPCTFLSGQKTPRFKLLIVTTSPSPLVGQDKGVILSELTKQSRKHIMAIPTVEEVKKMAPEEIHTKISKFSCNINGTLCCVPRWLMFNDEECMEFMTDSCSRSSQNAMKEWFLTNKECRVRDQFLPYRLLVIERMPVFGWAATGFVCDYVANWALKWAQLGCDFDRKNFISLLENPFSGGLIGRIYENWVFACIEKGRKIEIHSGAHLATKAKRVVSQAGVKFANVLVAIIDRFTLLQTFQFKSIGSYRWVWTRSKGMNKDADPNFRLEQGVLYRPLQHNFPSIDACGLLGDVFIMLRMAVSEDHSAVEMIHIKDLIDLARDCNSGKPLDIVVIFLSPHAKRFTIPQQVDLLSSGIKVFAGNIENDDFYETLCDKLNH